LSQGLITESRSNPFKLNANQTVGISAPHSLAMSFSVFFWSWNTHTNWLDFMYSDNPGSFILGDIGMSALFLMLAGKYYQALGSLGMLH
jgi:hypothetical protein